MAEVAALCIYKLRLGFRYATKVSVYTDRSVYLRRIYPGNLFSAVGHLALEMEKVPARCNLTGVSAECWYRVYMQFCQLLVSDVDLHKVSKMSGPTE